MKQWPAALRSRLLFCAAAGALIPLAAVLATEVDPTSLRNDGWIPVSERDPGTGPCNYLYADNHNHLLYYGTSGNCTRRINEHFNNTRSGYEMIEAMMSFVPPNERIPLQNNMVNWAVETNGSGQSLNHGSSDNCLGVVSTKSPLQIWYTPLPSRVNAANVEACVLARVIGYCNRQGAGTTRASWIAFRSAIQECSR